MDRYPLAIRYLVRLSLIIVLIFMLVMGKQLLVPLFFSVLLSYLLYPAARRMEEAGIPRVVTNFSLIIISILLLLGLVYGMALLVVTFSENLPEIKEQFEQNVSYFQQSIGNLIGVSEDRQDEMLNGIGSVGEYLAGFFTATTNTAVAIALLPVYTFLLLLYRNKFQQFLLDVVAPERRETIERILNQAASVVPSYLKGLLVVVLILIVVNSLGFYLIGIEYALLLGIIAALFNLIPYLGTIVGFGAVLLIVLATQTPSLSLGVLLMFFPVQFFENNILTPNITGSYVRINPLVIILSLIGAGMIWGLAGMFLVIPYLAMFKIFCENVDSLKPVGFLLGTRGTEKFMLSMGSFTRFFSKK